MIQIVENILVTETHFSGLVLTVGSFDGVHLGHREILRTVVSQARDRGGIAAVLTLKPHPREFFSPEHAPSLLTHDRKKWQLFEEAGVDAVFILPFDAAVASLEPADFVQRILVDRCGVQAVVVGHDFRFGHRARGDFELLQALAPEHGFAVSQVPPLLMDGERVSSTLIRERLLVGDLEKAGAFLGRPYSIVGEVVSGRKVGKTIGFPTANIEPHHSAIPAQGVYVALAGVCGSAYPAAVNIGVAPTIRNEDMTIEAFLLDFDDDLEGCEIELTFLQRIRAELKFPSVSELITQIGRDVDVVRAYFESNPL